MRGARLTLSAAIALLSCGRAPEEAVDLALESIAARDRVGLTKAISSEYADPLGSRTVLLEDVDDWWQRHPRITMKMTEVSVDRGASELDATVVAIIDAELVGTPTWKVSGTIQVETTRSSDGFRVRSGLLTTLRDAERLMDRRRAALEANDAAEVGRLLHPAYRDGDLDRDEAIQRLSIDVRDRKLRLEVTNYRLDLRGDEAHVDEHLVMRIDDTPTRPLVGRYTLDKSAGRWRISAGLYRDAQ